MIGEASIGEFALGESRSPPTEDVIVTQPFDYLRTIISQYANSPVLLELIANMASYIDPSALYDDFFNKIWNIDTAQGHGLDIWGRIVGVDRVLRIPGVDKYFGFEQTADGYPFNEGVFFNTGAVTENFALSDNAYRRLIFAKALANICDGSIAAINQILINLFSQYGNCYVVDGGDMTLTYTFSTRLSVVDFAIVSQSGVLPRPAGVLALVDQP